MFVYRGKLNLYDHEYTKKLQYALRNDLEETKPSNIQRVLDKVMYQTGINYIFESLNCLLTFILIIFYILSTYTYPATDSVKASINEKVNLIEIFICSIIVFHYVLKCYISQSRLNFVLDYFNFIDLATVLCILFAQADFVNENVKYFLRLFRIIRVFYLFRMEETLQKIFNETVRYSYKLSMAILSLILISSGLVLEVENYNYRSKTENNANIPVKTGLKGSWKTYQFHDMFYFFVVTFSTAGYGDTVFRIVISRMIILLSILGLLFAVLPVYSKFSALYNLTSKYSRRTYKKRGQKTKHLVVFGECGCEGLEAFFEELYNDDHGSTNYDTVMMQETPNDEIMQLIKTFAFSNKIHYLVGNGRENKDLSRCKANQSICAIILADKLNKNPQKEDYNNIMKAFNFKKFSRGKDIRVCIQLLRPQSKEMLLSLTQEDEFNDGDQIICVEEIKLQLLGKSCLCPGITTIISSLITSKKPTIEDSTEFIQEKSWLNEYLEGIQLEIYVVSLKAELIYNMRFIDIVKLLYDIKGLVVIGIDVIIDNFKPFVCLNPSSYLASPFDHLVYILADKQPDEDEINEQLKKFLEKKRKGIIENNKSKIKLLRTKNQFWKEMSNGQTPVFRSITPQANERNIEYKTYEALPIKRDGESNSNNNNNTKLKRDGNTQQDNKVNKTFHKSVTIKNKDNSTLILKENTSGYKGNNITTNIKSNNDNSSAAQKIIEHTSNQSQKFLYTVLPRTQFEAESFSIDTMENHIIVCGIGFNLKNLLMPLRASSMKNQQYPILIIDKYEHIPSEIWKEIQYYPDIYYIQGNPIKSKDLNKAGIKKAKAVIILSKSSLSQTHADMMDADTIFIYKAIKNETKTALIIAELISSSSISFINSNSEDLDIKKQGYWLSESSAVGEIYISSMLDTLICQAFYNPYITNILQQLIMGSAGSNYSIPLTKKLQEKKISQSTLYLLNINEELSKFGTRTFSQKMKYHELFKFFVNNNMVPIGVYRNSGKIGRLVAGKNEQCYVFLSPDRDVDVDIDNDKIYILAGEDYLQKEKAAKELKNKTSLAIHHNIRNIALDKTSEFALDILKSTKDMLENSLMVLQKSLSMKETVNSIRTSARNQLAQIHDEIAEFNEINDNVKESSGSAVSEENVSQLSNSDVNQSDDKSRSDNSDSNYDNDSIEGLKRE